ncbi:cell division protein [Bacillus sp. LL01]|uniref:SRPBCC family protein n=1 Tax=Bacillus sp. LL01 TaxID=1665556 RepID=UPI00064D075C|nr:SRPBCC family protein [Bacillus sp. LL01]KMJ57522.1 cell division protein [Bacillus sp. LL01]
MPVIKHQIYIEAPIEKCFDLARDVEVHTKTTKKTRERAVSGRTKGLLNKGDRVTWEAVHLGVKQRLTAEIIEMSRPHLFVDVMVKGAFHSFTHTHEFKEQDTGTMMVDTFEYKSPLGPIGIMVDRWFLKKYMRNFIKERAIQLKKIAERETGSTGL